MGITARLNIKDAMLNEGSQYQKVHIVWFLYNILKRQNYSDGQELTGC